MHVLGNPLRFLPNPGQSADITIAAELVHGYDSDQFVALLSDNGTAAVIPSRRNRKHQRVIDRNLYRDRNKVERFFA